MAREAIARAHERAVKNPADAEAVGMFGRVLHAWEQWEAAQQAYARAAALAPREFEWPYLQAVVLQRLARQAEAAVKLEAALALRSDYLPARVRLADAMFEGGDFARLERLYADITDPAAAPAIALLRGRIAADRGKHDEAIAHLQRAITLFPEYGAAHYALARSYSALGRRAEAQVAAEHHAKYGARWPAIEDPVLAAVNALRGDAAALLQRGVKRADIGDLEGAIAAHEAAVAADPNFAQAHVNLVSLYGRVRNWAKAEDHYRAVVKLGVNVADAHYDYGVVLGLQHRWDEAAAAYERALQANPLHAEAHNNLGQILERQRKLHAAADKYRKALDSQPMLRIARFNLARMLIALDKPAEAIRELETITEPRDAETPRYLFALATAHIRAGNRAEGIKWATEARDLALKHGDQALADAIEQDLKKIR